MSSIYNKGQNDCKELIFNELDNQLEIVFDGKTILLPIVEFVRLMNEYVENRSKRAIKTIESNTDEGLNYSKFGFNLYKTSESGCVFYRRQFEWFYLELMVSADIHSLYMNTKGEKEMIIANRYKIDNQEQLDFLILNGRVGEFFNEETK